MSVLSIGQRELALKRCLYRFLSKAFLRRFSNLLNPTGLTTFPIRASPDHCLRPAAGGDIGASAVFFALFGGCFRGVVPRPDVHTEPANGGEMEACPDPQAPIYLGRA